LFHTTLFEADFVSTSETSKLTANLRRQARRLQTTSSSPNLCFNFTTRRPNEEPLFAAENPSERETSFRFQIQIKFHFSKEQKSKKFFIPIFQFQPTRKTERLR